MQKLLQQVIKQYCSDIEHLSTAEENTVEEAS